MKFTLILSLIFCSIYATNCLDATLNSICQDDQFDYDNRLVSKVYHVRLHQPVPPLNHFTLDASLNFDTWSKKVEEIKEINQKKDEYNKMITEFYTSERVNNFINAGILKVKYDVLSFRDYFASWYSKIGYGEKFAWHAIQRKFEFTNKVLSRLILLKKDQFNEQMVPETMMIYLVMNLDEKLQKSNEGRLAFETHKHYHYYSERIARFDKITVGKHNNTLSLFIPVYSFSNDKKNETCLSAKELPTFYKENNLKYVD